MDSFFCCSLDGISKANFLCVCSDPPTYLCDEHSAKHLQVPLPQGRFHFLTSITSHRAIASKEGLEQARMWLLQLSGRQADLQSRAFRLGDFQQRIQTAYEKAAIELKLRKEECEARLKAWGKGIEAEVKRAVEETGMHALEAYEPMGGVQKALWQGWGRAEFVEFGVEVSSQALSQVFQMWLRSPIPELQRVAETDDSSHLSLTPNTESEGNFLQTYREADLLPRKSYEAFSSSGANLRVKDDSSVLSHSAKLPSLAPETHLMDGCSDPYSPLSDSIPVRSTLDQSSLLPDSSMSMLQEPECYHEHQRSGKESDTSDACSLSHQAKSAALAQCKKCSDSQRSSQKDTFRLSKLSFLSISASTPCAKSKKKPPTPRSLVSSSPGWRCPCGRENTFQSVICAACFKPHASPTGSLWVCVLCNTVNRDEVSVCRKCSHGRKIRTQGGGERKRCLLCETEVVGSATHCSRCLQGYKKKPRR